MTGLNKSSEFGSVIAASWDRCRRFGLSHESRPEHPQLSRQQREQLRHSHSLLLETTEREVLPYYENILANSRCMIVLADDKGAILSNWGDRRFIESPRKPLFREGANWQEQVSGTNAIGTAIACGHAVQVQRNEHYLKTNRFMIGSAAPILDEQQNLVAVLNVSSDAYLPQAHTLGMVRLMSQSVENRLLIHNFSTCFMLTFNTNADNLDSQWSGLVAFDETGRIVAANQRAVLLLGMSLEQRLLTEVFELSRRDLVPSTDLVTLQLHTAGQRTFHGQIRRPVRPATTVPASGRVQQTAPDTLTFEDIEFGDPRLQRSIQQARRVMDRDIPILIRGETGVGKEVFVKALHQASVRNNGPMVAVNCAAIPSELVESELFGYEKGAFTGANTRGAVGMIRKAHGGVLFLDEIGEMPLSAQARLLRVLQEREVTPLGSTENFPVDIRLISATNQHLRAQLQNGHFRADLYYRLSGLSIELPPLRARADKRELFRQVHARYRDSSQYPELSEALLELFEQHPWPGNIRQLINVLQVALAMADSGPLETWHLPDEFVDDVQAAARPSPAGGTNRADIQVKVEHSSPLLAVFNHYQGNVSKIARHLGCSRNTVYKRLRELGIRQ
nr:sigma-54-dependent Fis family transcriptional regulator [Marinobacter salicampi]